MAVVTPLLWETLTTDLVQSGQRHMLGLASPQSNILKHVRNIYLQIRSITGNGDHLPQFLAAIPRGQLRGFKSVGKVELATVDLLLLLQPKLEVFDVPGGILAKAVESSWTTGCFSNLTSVVIYADNFSSETLQSLWNECPKLTFLELKRDPNLSSFATSAPMNENAFLPGPNRTFSTSTAEDNISSIVLHVNTLKLNSLHIGNITLPKILTTMFQRIDVLTLRELALDTFRGASELLEALSQQFAKGVPSLKRLQIVHLADQVTDDFTTSIFVFLTSFCGLQELVLQCTNCGKIDPDSIVNHGETLTRLTIINGGLHRENKARCFNATDLQKIATACPELERLSLNLYEIDPDRNESDFLGPQSGVAFVPNEFEKALNAIASMPKLHSLRLTNPPNYRKVYHRPGEFYRWYARSLQNGTERFAFQARADGIMGYLGMCGSNIKTIVFSPVETLKKADKPDKHGNIWPDYWYRRGRLANGKGKEVAVARPLASWQD